MKTKSGKVNPKKGGLTMSSVLNAVYNNYLTTYSPKTLTRFDTHKKSELRNVYNSIVKINKEAPWYLPTTSKDTQQYAISLKENARELHNSLAQLGGLESDELFSKKSAYSSNDSIAEATYIGPNSQDVTVPDLELEVRSLATPQENMGLFLADEPAGLAAATYSFDISTGGMNYEFQFSVGESETNRSIQERLIRLINNSDIGIKASLSESEGRTSLCLTSAATGLPAGKTHLFTVNDTHTSQQSGTVEYFGLDYTSRKASNAVFLLNGEERSASSNHFTIGKQFEVQLKGVSNEGQSTRIGLKTDIECLSDNISHLIGSYNEFVKAAAAYSQTQAKSRQLVQEMQGIASLYGSSLESTGINMTEDGTLAIDGDLLRQAAHQSEDINDTFGYLKSFSSTLLRKSNQVSLNPMEYVNKTIVAYKNPGKNFVSPYTTSAYSGMLFNGYC